MTRRLSLSISALAIVVSLLNHFHGYEAYLLRLNTTHPILSLPKRDDTVAKPALTKKLTFVFLDGLGFEASQQLPTLKEYQARAAWLPLLVEFPSYTYPGIVAYATGVPPRYSGLRLNHQKHLSHLSLGTLAPQATQSASLEPLSTTQPKVASHSSLPTILQEASNAGYSVQIDNGDWSEFGDLLDFEKKFPRSKVDSLLPSSSGKAQPRPGDPSGSENPRWVGMPYHPGSSPRTTDGVKDRAGLAPEGDGTEQMDSRLRGNDGGEGGNDGGEGGNGGGGDGNGGGGDGNGGERAATWIYFGAIDAAGHKHGGDSEQYRAAALKGDALVRQLIEGADLSRETIVVVSDHGHLSQGGHGGVEPEVTRAMFFALGSGVGTPTEKKERSYLDVVPTLAALLGAANPAASLGAPMLDVLQATPAEKAKLLLRTVEQRALIERALLDDIYLLPQETLAAMQAGDANTIETAQHWLQEMTRLREEAFVSQRDYFAWRRLYWAIGASALLLLGIVWLQSKKRLSLRLLDLLPTILYTAIFMPLYYLAGYGISWSLPRGEPGFMIETALIGAVAVAAALSVSRRRNQWQRLGEETLWMTLCFGLPYLWYSAWIGLDPVYLGDAVTSFVVIFLATIAFYAHGPYGVWLLLRNRKINTPAGRAADI